MSAKRRLVEAALSPLADRAWRRGVLGGDRTWLGIGLGVWVLRRARHKREEEVVFTQQLARGQSLLISHGPPSPTRRVRRRAARATVESEGAAGSAPPG